MPDNSRIEDLRKRYHENPRRFFAPLANEYRKSGMLDRALLLCQKHVGEQPENMNGLIVYGQTLFELQQHEAAREPFEQALRLDLENLIALRHLGDIARLTGDAPAAKGWYERVLELDRRNDEVLDLLAQLGGDASAESAPPARPSTTAGGLVSVAASVSVSGGPDVGLIDLAAPSAPATPVASGKGGTVVIDAQKLADRDRAETDGTDASAAPAPAAVPAPAASTPAPPSKRASLLDISFDFGEPTEPAAAPVVPQAPVLGAEAAEYGFADTAPAPDADTLIVETTGDVAPLSMDAPPAAPAADATLGLEPTIAAPEALPLPEAPAGDFELAEFSAEVAPLAGLEATEFTSEQVAPMAEFEPDSVSVSMPSIHPLADLDRPDVSVEDVPSIEGLDSAMAVPAADEPSGLDGLADLPLLDDASTEAPLDAARGEEFVQEAPIDEAPIEEAPSARARPRMTKKDLASLPLLADFGLDDDSVTDVRPKAAAPVEPAPESAAPAAAVPTPELAPDVVPDAAPAANRASKATPTFATETMAALYMRQGLIAEAIGVYQQLIEASPDNAGLRAKLAELERMQRQASAGAAASPADEMPEFEPPVDVREPAPAPANAAMADVSFGGIGLQGQGSVTPLVTPAVAAGPNAREFFAAFARRAAAVGGAAAPAPTRPSMERAAEPSVEAQAVATSGWPLDALFGAADDVRDLHAAETLAGVSTFAGPDGGTGLDAVVAPETAPPRRSVPRASETLKFDQFFQKPGPAAEPAPVESADPDDDLDQFQDWLKGLKQ